MPSWPRRILSRDSVAGMGFVATGAAFAVGAQSYGIGTLAAMQAGFFPLTAGVVAMCIGAVVTTMALIRDGDGLERPALRSVLFVAASVVIFALTIDRLGLVPSVLISTALCAMADCATRLREALLLAAGMAAGTWLVFIELLGMPITIIAGV